MERKCVHEYLRRKKSTPARGTTRYRRKGRGLWNVNGFWVLKEKGVRNKAKRVSLTVFDCSEEYYMKRLFLIVLGWLALSFAAQAASFDCVKAVSKVEKLICADPELSKLDEKLAATYKTALQDEKQAETIRRSQKQWMKDRNSCADAICLKHTYEARLQGLSNDGGYAKHKAVSPKSSRWFLREGKGYVLCESLLKIANQNPIPSSSVEPLIVPWQDVLAIKGVSEPPWEKLDPAEYEDLFLKVWRLYDHPNPPDKKHCFNHLEHWFSYAFPLPEREETYYARYCADTSPEARLPLTLAAYRQFVKIGGKLKLYRFDWGDKDHPVSTAILQYDMPDGAASTTANFTIAFRPDLSEPRTEWTGPSSRLLLYRGEPFIFEGYGRHRVHKLTWPLWDCGIDY